MWRQSIPPHRQPLREAAGTAQHHGTLLCERFEDGYAEAFVQRRIYKEACVAVELRQNRVADVAHHGHALFCPVIGKQLLFALERGVP